MKSKTFLAHDPSFTVSEIVLASLIERTGAHLDPGGKGWVKDPFCLKVWGDDLGYLTIFDSESAFEPIASIDYANIRTQGYSLYWNGNLRMLGKSYKEEKVITTLKEVLNLKDGQIFSVQDLKKFDLPKLSEIYQEVFGIELPKAIKAKKAVLQQMEENLNRIAKKEVVKGGQDIPGNEESAYIYCPARGYRVHELVCRRWKNTSSCSSECHLAPKGTSRVETKRERRRIRKMEQKIEEKITEKKETKAPKGKAPKTKEKKETKAPRKVRSVAGTGKSRHEIISALFKANRGKITEEMVQKAGAWKNPKLVMFSISRKGKNPIKCHYDKEKKIWIQD